MSIQTLSRHFQLVPWNRNRFCYSGGNFVRWEGAKKANTRTYSTDEQRRQRAKGPANYERNYGSRGLAAVTGLAVLLLSVSALAQDEAPAVAPAEDTSGDVQEITDEPAPAPAPAPAAEPAPAPAPAHAPASAAAEPEAKAGPEAEPETEPEEEKTSAGVNVDVGVSSIYNFRGWNSFQDKGQNDQNYALFPSVTWSIFDSGVYLGYWGAFQMSGGNHSEMVDIALGHEQDLYLGWDKSFGEKEIVGLSIAFTYYFYPFAKEIRNPDGSDNSLKDPVTGEWVTAPSNPSIIEPLIGLNIATVIDIGFTVSYFHGIQDELDILRHVYFNLSLGKGFEFNDVFGMNLGMSFGAKAWIEENNSNRFDLCFDIGLPINLTDQLYVEPAFHLGWTDLENVAAVADDPNTPNVDETAPAFGYAGDEYMAYWSINVGANF